MKAARRTWAQRARRLSELRSVARCWRERIGLACGYALDAMSMIVIADRACLDLAAALIAAGSQQ